LIENVVTYVDDDLTEGGRVSAEPDMASADTSSR
jgi:hypothetical protein